MYVEILELYQEDCPNISLTEKLEDLDIFIVDVRPSKQKETLRSYIIGSNPKDAIEKLSQSKRVFDVEIYSKSREIVEIQYDIGMTRAWKVVHSFGGKVIGPIIVHKDLERWLVIWEDLKTRKKAVKELKKTDLTKIRRSLEFEPYIFSTMLLNIEGVFHLVRELSKLTPTQLESLKESYLYGLYDIPRRTTLEILSSNSGISKTAYLKRLRNAEKRIVYGVLKFFEVLR